MTDGIAYETPDYSAGPPPIYASSFPLGEQGACDLLNGQLRELASYTDDFAAALELFDMASKDVPQLFASFDSSPEEKRAIDTKRRWCFIAAKDGAMTVYHFGQTLDLIRGGLGDCPTLRAMIDTDVLKEVDKRFKRKFPFYERLRHAVAHQSIVSKAPYMAVVRSDGSGRLIITGSLSGRRFISVWKEHRVEYEISDPTLKELASMRDCVFTAFANASAISKSMPPYQEQAQSD